MILRSARILAFALALLAPMVAPLPQAGAAEPVTFDLRVVTLNVYGVPLPDLRPERWAEMGRRIQALREQGLAPHVLALQEVFLDTTLEAVQKWGYPYLARGPLKQGTRLGGGTVILSEFPIEESAWEAYSTCTSWDCFVRKGALGVTLRVPGIEAPVAIFDTHTNADPSYDPLASREKARIARATQLREAAAFFQQYRPTTSPALFVGDFNTSGEADDYREFVASTKLQDAVEFCGRKGPCSGDPEALREWVDMLDHHFYSDSASVQIQPVHYDLLFKEPFGGKPITDHPIVWVTYRLTQEAKNPMELK